MAHKLESMAFFGETPWHGLGTRLSDADVYDWKRASRKAGLNWEVELVPLSTDDTKVPVDHRAARRTSDGKILGVVGARYVVLQNQDAFLWFQPFLEAKEAALHTAGALFGGSRIWVLARLQRDPLVIAQGDEIEKFLLLSHSHDGTLAVRVGFTPIRVVCNNTLSLAHATDASQLIRVKHTKEMHDNLDNIRDVMNLANAKFDATAEQYRLLARKGINQADLRHYVKRVLQVEGAISTRTENMIKKIIGLCEAGRGNDLASVRGTYWTAYNGVTEWLGYQRCVSQQNRINSLWFGDSATMSRHALKTALAMAS